MTRLANAVRLGDSLDEDRAIVAAKPKVVTLAEQLAVIEVGLKQRQEAERHAAEPEWLPKLQQVQGKVMQFWPMHWPCVEAQLATCATLLMKNVGQSLALFTVGPSGSGKSTVLFMFGVSERELLVHQQAGFDTLVEELDNFRPASWLSHYEGKTARQLEEQALYRRVSQRVLLTSDLAKMFRGNVQHLEETFGILVRVLDGEGLRTDTGVHGTLGMKGSFPFVWLAGTTPFREETWRTMATLGTRLLFYRVRDGADGCPGDLYFQARNECRGLIFPLLQRWRRNAKNVDARRRLPWPEISKEITAELRSLAELVAAGQTLRSNREEEEIVRPSAAHFRMRLTLLACGRAVMCGRSVVDESDLPLLRHVAQSSMYAFRGPVLVALHVGIRTVPEICAYARLACGRARSTESTVQKTLETLQALKIVSHDSSKPYRWSLCEELGEAL